MMIKNLEKVAQRIIRAVNLKERIVLYGDTDLDGVSSVIILKEAIEFLGGGITAFYFPDREKEGYGITNKALKYLSKFKKALLITLDCGIGNFKEIKIARKMGLEVIVIDHHKVLGRIPQADIVVDPKQPGDKYPFKELAAVGIVFKLAERLLSGQMDNELKKSFLELTALATLADMMPKVHDNKVFIEKGLEFLKDSKRPGIKAFTEADFLKGYNMHEKVYKIISILNFRDLKDNLPISFQILTSQDKSELRKKIKELKIINDKRKGNIKKIVDQIKKKNKKDTVLIFDGKAAWEYSLISSVASIICKDLKKSAFIYKKMKDESQGTVRVPHSIDSVAWMEKCKKYVLTYGGHPAASGFRIKNKNLKQFKNCLIENL